MKYSEGDPGDPKQPSLLGATSKRLDHPDHPKRRHQRAQRGERGAGPKEGVLQAVQDLPPMPELVVHPGLVELLDVTNWREGAPHGEAGNPRRALVPLHPDQREGQAKQSEENRAGDCGDSILVSKQERDAEQRNEQPGVVAGRAGKVQHQRGVDERRNAALLHRGGKVSQAGEHQEERQSLAARGRRELQVHAPNAEREARPDRGPLAHQPASERKQGDDGQNAENEAEKPADVLLGRPNLEKNPHQVQMKRTELKGAVGVG